MKILHRFMLKQFIGPFIAIFVLAMIVLLMQFLWKYIDDLVGKGLEIKVIAELLLYTCGQLSVLAFPLAVLLASIFTLGNMGENYELIALKSAGVSLQRIVFPLIALSFVIAGVAFYCANNVIPVATLKMRALIYDIQQARPELQIQEGIFYNGIDGYSIRIGKRDYKTNMLYDLMIYNHTQKAGNVDVIRSDSGLMQMTVDKRFLEVTLFYGHGYVEQIETGKRNPKTNPNYPFRRHIFDKQIFRMELPGYDIERSDPGIFKSGHQMMNISQLTDTIDGLSKMIIEQENQLRMIVLPTYRNPELQNIPIDTTLRSRIPDDYRAAFDKMTKSKRQSTVREAVNNVRSQKDQVAGIIYELDAKNKQIWRYEIAWHQKFTMPLACFILFFIGAPLGAIIRKGGLGTPIIIAVLFFVFYYVISMIGEKSARAGAMTSFAGIWMSTFIIFTIGVFLTWMATKDSSIFNIEMYANYIKKGLNYIFVTYRTPRPEIFFTANSSDLEPENMIFKLDEFSQRCRAYLDGDFRKPLRFSKIWYEQEDLILTEIGNDYDNLRALMKQLDVEIVRETVDEYPLASLHNCKIKQTSKWQPLIAAVIIPIWFYLYLKTLVQMYTLRNELQNIMLANRNLVNELNSTF